MRKLEEKDRRKRTRNAMPSIYPCGCLSRPYKKDAIILDDKSRICVCGKRYVLDLSWKEIPLGTKIEPVNDYGSC